MSLTVIAVGTGVAWAWGRYKKKQRAEMAPPPEDTLLLPAVPPMEAMPEGVVIATEPESSWGQGYAYNLTVNAYSSQLNAVASEITIAQSLTAFQNSVTNAIDALSGAAKAGIQDSQTFLNSANKVLSVVGDYVGEKKDTAENMWLIGSTAEKLIDAAVKAIPYAETVIAGFKFLKSLIAGLGECQGNQLVGSFFIP